MKQFTLQASNNTPSNYEDFLKEIPLKKIMSLIFFFSGIVLICSGLVRVHENRINPSWLPVEGLVVKSGIESCTIPSNNGKSLNNIYYSAKITYEYYLTGRALTSSAIVGIVSKNYSKTYTRHNK